MNDINEVGNEGIAPAVTTAVASSPIAIQIAFGSTIAAMHIDGTRTVRRAGHKAISFIEPSLISEVYDGEVNFDSTELPAIPTQSNMQIPVGSGVVFGPANVGKTPLLKAIVRETNGVLIRFGEPFPGYITEEEEAAVALLDALLDPAIRLVAIDSIKDVLVDMHGGLMARGVPRGVFRLLSQWASVAASLNKAIVVPLNISTDEKSALDEVSSAVISNTTFSLVADAGSSKNSVPSFEFVGRTGEGKRRMIQRWSLTYRDDGLADVKIAGDLTGLTGSPKGGREVTVSSMQIPLDATRRAIGRALRNAFQTNESEQEAE